MGQKKKAKSKSERRKSQGSIGQREDDSKSSIALSGSSLDVSAASIDEQGLKVDTPTPLREQTNSNEELAQAEDNVAEEKKAETAAKEATPKDNKQAKVEEDVRAKTEPAVEPNTNGVSPEGEVKDDRAVKKEEPQQIKPPQDYPAISRTAEETSTGCHCSIQ